MRVCIKTLHILLLASYILTSTCVSAAEDPPAQFAMLGPAQTQPFPSEDFTRRISLDLRNMDLMEALKFLSLKAGLNIVPTNNVMGRVTLTVENVPIKDVFDIMLRSNNLAYDKKGEIYNVMTEHEYKALYGRKFSDMRSVKIFRLKYAVPKQAFNLIDAVKSDIGRLLVDSESGTVLLMDTPEKIKEAQDTIKALEQETCVRIFTLKYASASDVSDLLKVQLDLKNLGYIKADERTNQVIVQTLPERMKNIEELITGLDKKTQGVLIEVKIIKIKLSDQLSRGIEWEGIFSLARQYGMTYLGSYPFSLIQSATDAAANSWQSREQFLNSPTGMHGDVGAYPFSGSTTNFIGALNDGAKLTAGEKLHLGIVDGKRDFDIIIKYLQTLGKTKILSSPTLAAVNNKEAKIHIGERRAYVTTTTTTGSSTATVAEEVTYVDIGVSLSITPMINEDRYITMKVKPEISSVIGSITTSSDNVIPIIDTSTAETTVIAKDGATIVLGGLGREEKTENTKQVPLLGKIPLIGWFFTNSTHTVERTEMVIMLTPIITEGDKLITAQDAQKTNFTIKERKQFDIFKGGDIIEPIPALPVSKSPGPLKNNNGFSPKGFKKYEAKQKISAKDIHKISSYKDEARLIGAKGIRTYDQK